MSMLNMYPEAAQQSEYSVKDLMELTTINRKTFDKFKSLFPQFYRQNSWKGKTKNKMFYSPMIYVICKEIVKKQKSGLSNSEIEKSFFEEGLISENRKAEKTEERKTLETAIIKRKTKEKLQLKNKGNSKENKENSPYIEELENDFLRLKNEILEKEKELNDRSKTISVLEERLKGKDQLIEEKVKICELMDSKIMLIEAPLKSKEIELNKTKEELLETKKQLSKKEKQNIFWISVSIVIICLYSLYFFYPIVLNLLAK